MIKQITDKQQFVRLIEFNKHWEVINYVLTHHFQFFKRISFIPYVQEGRDLRRDLLNTGQNELHSLMGQINTGGESDFNKFRS